MHNYVREAARLCGVLGLAWLLADRGTEGSMEQWLKLSNPREGQARVHRKSTGLVYTGADRARSAGNETCRPDQTSAKSWPEPQVNAREDPRALRTRPWFAHRTYSRMDGEV
jgi:hypothetical protein